MNAQVNVTGNHAQAVAKAQYIRDRAYSVSYIARDTKHAVYAGMINTQTGKVNWSKQIVWRNWGKQASRTEYVHGSKVSETIYTW